MSAEQPAPGAEQPESQKIQVLKDRVIPGSTGAIEQLVIANHAVIVIASTPKKGRLKVTRKGVKVGGASIDLVITGLQGRVIAVRHMLGGEAPVFGALVLSEMPKTPVTMLDSIPVGSATSVFEHITQLHQAASPRNLKAIAYDLHGIFIESNHFGAA